MALGGLAINQLSRAKAPGPTIEGVVDHQHHLREDFDAEMATMNMILQDLSQARARDPIAPKWRS
jgi:hypothetical protein